MARSSETYAPEVKIFSTAPQSCISLAVIDVTKGELPSLSSP
jgi:hypothetical protein